MQTIPGYRLSIPYTRMSNHPPNTSNCFCSICRYTRSIRRRPVYYNLYIMEQSVGLPLLGTSHIPQLTQPALWMLASASGITPIHSQSARVTWNIIRAPASPHRNSPRRTTSGKPPHLLDSFGDPRYGAVRIIRAILWLWPVEISIGVLDSIQQVYNVLAR